MLSLVHTYILTTTYGYRLLNQRQSRILPFFPVKTNDTELVIGFRNSSLYWNMGVAITRYW
jgi:hypothetical protein